MQYMYIESFPLQRILQSNQIAERAIRHEIKWRRSKKSNLERVRLAFPDKTKTCLSLQSS